MPWQTTWLCQIWGKMLYLSKFYLPQMAPMDVQWETHCVNGRFGTPQVKDHTYQCHWCSASYARSLKLRPSALSTIHPGFGLGMWMTPLSPNRLNTTSSSYNTLIPLIYIFTSPQRFPAAVDPSLSWIPYFLQDLTTHY